MTCPPPELMIVMPVFNEQASVGTVVRDWFRVLERVVPDFVMLAIDDGSADATPAILEELQEELGARFEWITRENRGHGQTCMQGYRLALERGIPYLFQIDSDGQCEPQYFRKLWELRETYDVIYGRRTRQDGLRRVVASRVLRLLLRVVARVDCVDANVPYRLMRGTACAEAIGGVPGDFELANIALAVCLKRDPRIRHGAVAIGFPCRQGGEPSVPFSKFAAKAVQLRRQLRAMLEMANP